MATPSITDFILYTVTPLTDTDYEFNWNKLVSYLTDGTTDIEVNSIATTNNANIGGDLTVTGAIVGATVSGDGSGLTNMPSNYYDRGYTNTRDFTIGDLTVDGSYHGLDLSLIVPSGAKAVLLGVEYGDNSTATGVLFAQWGTPYDNVNCVRLVSVTGVQDNKSVIVGFDTTKATPQDRYIQYSIDVGWNTLSIVVRGWWK